MKRREHPGNAPLHCTIVFEWQNRSSWQAIGDLNDEYSYHASDVLATTPALARKLLPDAQWTSSSANDVANVQLCRGAVDRAAVSSHVMDANIVCSVSPCVNDTWLLPCDLSAAVRTYFDSVCNDATRCVCAHNYCTLAELDAAGWERDFRYPHYRDLAKTVKRMWRHVNQLMHSYSSMQYITRNHVRLVYWFYRVVPRPASPPQLPARACKPPTPLPHRPVAALPLPPPPPPPPPSSKPPHIVVTVDSLSSSSSSDDASYESLDMEAGSATTDADFDRFVAQRTPPSTSLPFDAGSSVLVVARDLDELSCVAQWIAARLGDTVELHHINGDMPLAHRRALLADVKDEAMPPALVSVTCSTTVQHQAMIDTVEQLVSKTPATVVLQYRDSLRRLLDGAAASTPMPWHFDHVVVCPSASQRDAEAAFQLSELHRAEYEQCVANTPDAWCLPAAPQQRAHNESVASARLQRIMGDLQPPDALFIPLSAPAHGVAWRPMPLRNVFPFQTWDAQSKRKNE